ncbi:MAG: helix-turn-helix domain-containing protein [Gemmataceae bacterium]
MRVASLSRFVATPETRSALVAVRSLARGLAAGKPLRTNDPLFLHGPPGVGKTHLAAGLIATVADAGRTARLIAAAEIVPAPDGPPDALEGADACDLLIVEDMQHLPPSAADAFARLIDYRTPRRLPTLVTANTGPAQLSRLPPRLTSRLSAGLVVGLEPLASPSRRYVLHRLATERKLKTAAGVLDWIAEATPGGVRPLLGAIETLVTLTRGVPLPPDLAVVQAHWADQADGKSPVERVIQHVSKHFGLKPKALQTRRRQPAALWPVQVAMYLARDLTGLAWPRIGAAFGGRDASTVRSAYAKVAERIDADAAVEAELRRLRAELT